MEHAKLLVQRGHLLGVWRGIPASLSILLLLLSFLHDACFGRRKEDDPVRQAGQEGGGQRDQCTPPISRVKKAGKPARWPERPTRQSDSKYSGQNGLQTEVPGKCLGLKVGELQDGESFELNNGAEACLGNLSDSKSELQHQAHDSH